jgi:hypothetical protein
MKCPVCPASDLLMSVRNEIEIDYCPSCRGVWLDRGELDKIIERSAVDARPAPPPVPPVRDRYDSDRDYDRDKRNYDEDYYHRKRKKNFFEELFD